ncbi:MAG: hypothetical protein OQK25_02405 [Gammaproteobacteria bacterium]|nr:hypothetical protein [Gammaproteobacteria bacterium]MCW8982466.1 hypothetical protein [Gammaproteobacteria bacterium]
MNKGDIFVIEEKPCNMNDVAAHFGKQYPMYGVIRQGPERGVRLRTVIYLGDEEFVNWAIKPEEIRVIEEAEHDDFIERWTRPVPDAIRP